MYNERQTYLVNEESSDDAEESDSDEESGSASSSSSESEDDFEKFVHSNKKQPPRESPPSMTPELASGKLSCYLCPSWFNEYAQTEKIFLSPYDIEIHHKIWHNSRYMPNKCPICCFRAENLTELKHQHDNHPELCGILTQNKTYIRLEEHLEGSGSGRRGRKSRNASAASGKSDESTLYVPTQLNIPKPSSTSPKLPKPTIPKNKDEKKSKQPKNTSEFNIPTFDLTSSPSPDRSFSNRPSPHQQSPLLPQESPSSVVSSSHSMKSDKSSKSSPNTSMTKKSKQPAPKESNSPEEKDDKHSPKPENHKRWTFEEVTHVNDIVEGEAEFICDECNINELIWDKFKKSQLESHKKLWHSNYTYTECPKCNQRFETITDMNNSQDHKQHCVVWQAGNVLVSIYP